MLAQEVDNSLEQKCHGLLFHPMTTSQMACEPVSRMIKLPSSEVVVIHVFGVDPGKLYEGRKFIGSSKTICARGAHTCTCRVRHCARDFICLSSVLWGGCC